MPSPRDTSVLSPNLGLYLGIPPLTVPLRALSDGNNFRVKEGRLSALNLGALRFGAFTLNGPVVLIDNFFLRSGAQRLIFATPTDLYAYDEATEGVSFLTPVENTGTVDVSDADPAVVTSASGPTAFDTNGVKAGDEIAFGASDETDPAATWHVIASVDSDTQLTLSGPVAGAPLVGQDYTIRRLFTGDMLDQWETATFLKAAPGDEDLWFAVNGVDGVVKWDGNAAHAEFVSGLGFTCKTLAVYSNMMIYGNLIMDGGEARTASIVNSDVGAPEDVSSGLSEEFRVHDGVDPIVTLATLGDSLVIYSDRTMVLAQFVGDPLVFVFRVAVSGLGPISGRLVADFGDYHEFIGPDSQYRFDGVGLEETGFQVWREVLRQRDPNRPALAFSHFDEENGDLIWCVPLTTDPGVGGEDIAPPATAFAEHYLEEVGSRDPVPFSRRDFPFTCSGFYERQETLTWDTLTQTWQDLNFRWNDQFFLAAFPFNLVGNVDGEIFVINVAQNLDGAALRSFVRFGRRPLGDGRMRGLLRRVYPFATRFAASGHSLDVTVRLCEHASGPITAQETFAFPLDLAEGAHFVSPFRRARYFELEFGTDGPGEPWELEGYDIDPDTGGRR